MLKRTTVNQGPTKATILNDWSYLKMKINDYEVNEGKCFIIPR